MTDVLLYIFRFVNIKLGIVLDACIPGTHKINTKVDQTEDLAELHSDTFSQNKYKVRKREQIELTSFS